MRTLFVLAALALPGSMWAQLPCGSVVSGMLKLTADMVCNTQSALTVGADHTTIDLNGHTISCVGPGVGGSCQRMLDPMNPALTLPPLTFIGVSSFAKSKVRIKGPGTISGFGIGVVINGGNDTRVDGVTVTGPAQPSALTNQRLITSGITVVNTVCANGGDTATVRDNEVSNQSIGVFLQAAECVTVRDNHIHDNNSRFGDSHGIDVLNSRNNRITRNIIERNGANRLGGVSDSGIQLLNGVGGDTSNNLVSRNFVSDNCGDGVAAVIGANANTVERNSARFNGLNAFGGQCLAAPVGTFFDLAERAAGAGNVWNPNNQCRTNSATIPGGVCGPLE